MILRSQIPALIAAAVGSLVIVCVAYGFLSMSQSLAAACPGQMVKVSYYGQETCRPGKKCQTADGTAFDGTQMLVAHRSLPFGTKVKFTYKGRSVTLPVRDRGPFVAGRSYDLSEAAARKLGFIRAGVVTLCAEVL